MGVITFPLICTLPNISAATRQFITSTGIFLSVYCTIVILHGRRAVLLLLNYDINADHQYTKKKIAVSPMSSKAEFSRQSSILKALSENEFGGAQRNPFEAVKTKSLICRREICKEQIQHWSKVLGHTEAMMLVQAEDESVAPSSSHQHHRAPNLVPLGGSPHGVIAYSSASLPSHWGADHVAPQGSLLRSALSSIIPEIANASSEGSMVAVQRRNGLTLDVESLTNICASNYLQDTLESDVDEFTSPSESAST